MIFKLRYMFKIVNSLTLQITGPRSESAESSRAEAKFIFCQAVIGCQKIFFVFLISSIHSFWFLIQQLMSINGLVVYCAMCYWMSMGLAFYQFQPQGLL
jgi:hypothetical protein